MEPFAAKVLIGVIVGTVVTMITFYLKKRSGAIDEVEHELFNLQKKFDVMETKMMTIESNNIPVLLSIREDVGHVKVQMGIVQSEINNLRSRTNRQDSKIDNIDHNNFNFRRRKDDYDLEDD